MSLATFKLSNLPEQSVHVSRAKKQLVGLCFVRIFGIVPVSGQ